MNDQKINELTKELNKDSLEQKPINFRTGDYLEVTIKKSVHKCRCMFVRKRGILTKVGVQVQSPNQQHGFNISFFAFRKDIKIKLLRSKSTRRARVYDLS